MAGAFASANFYEEYIMSSSVGAIHESSERYAFVNPQSLRDSSFAK